MPPGSIIPDNNSNNNLSNLNNILLQDEIDYLLSHSETYRKSLRCPNCEKKGIFRRNGSTKFEPPQPIFRCNGCGSSFRAKTMLNIVNSMQSTPTNTQTSTNPEFSGSFQGAMSSEVVQTNSNQNDLQSLLNMIQLLTKELASARTEIERLRVQTVYLQEQLNQQNAASNTANPLNPSDFPPLRNTVTILLQSAPWHQSERFQQIKDQSIAQRNNDAYNDNKLPHVRVPIGQIRSCLRKLSTNNNRIIDIHYPDRNIVAFLIHNDYEDELRQQLQRFKVTIKEDFNPCNPQVLRNPKYADRTPAERENLAFTHHCNRIERALQYIRAPVKFAVARYFYSKG
ncbi:hypothetical protein RMATCC62417_13346 [Rhizopus microsporus]|nr:hypothetical protein RMATCC62417_13346 [Rhizopus microsporus]